MPYLPSYAPRDGLGDEKRWNLKNILRYLPDEFPRSLGFLLIYKTKMPIVTTGVECCRTVMKANFLNSTNFDLKLGQSHVLSLHKRPEFLPI